MNHTLRLVLRVPGNLHQAYIEALCHLAICLRGIRDQHSIGDDLAGQHRGDIRSLASLDSGGEHPLHLTLAGDQNGNLVGTESRSPSGCSAFFRRAWQAATLALERSEGATKPFLNIGLLKQLM